MRKIVLPDWIKWIAQERGGEWWAYEFKSHIEFSGWCVNKGRDDSIWTGFSSKNWKGTLKRIKSDG